MNVRFVREKQQSASSIACATELSPYERKNTHARTGRRRVERPCRSFKTTKCVVRRVNDRVHSVKRTNTDTRTGRRRVPPSCRLSRTTESVVRRVNDRVCSVRPHDIRPHVPDVDVLNGRVIRQNRQSPSSVARTTEFNPRKRMNTRARTGRRRVPRSCRSLKTTECVVCRENDTVRSVRTNDYARTYRLTTCQTPVSFVKNDKVRRPARERQSEVSTEVGTHD